MIPLFVYAFSFNTIFYYVFLSRIFLLVKPDDLVALKLRKTAAIEGKLLIVFFLRGICKCVLFLLFIRLVHFNTHTHIANTSLTNVMMG